MTRIILTQGDTTEHVRWPSVPREDDRVAIDGEDGNRIINGVVEDVVWGKGGVATVYVR